MSVNDKWTNKAWSTNTKQHYSAIRRNKILINATPRKTLKRVVLSVGSQPKGGTGLHSCGVPRRGNSMGTQSRLVTAWTRDWKGVNFFCLVFEELNSGWKGVNFERSRRGLVVVKTF